MRLPKTTCPICKTAMPADWSEYPDYPFCSRRCRTIDLGRWMGEDYRVQGKDVENQSSEIKEDEE